MHAAQWLSTLFEHTGGLVELRAIPNVRGEGRPQFLFTRDTDKVEEFVAHYQDKPYGVYFGAGTRIRPSGRADDVSELPGPWLDNDVTPKEELRRILLGCYCPPSYIVDSGRGLHAWWALDEWVGPSVEFITLLRSLARIFGGDKSVCDLARIMRLPGTYNSKYGEPRPVDVVVDTGHRYSFADLADWCSWQCELVGEPVNPFVAAAEALGIKDRVSLDDLKLGNLHNAQVRLSASMVVAGQDDDAIVAQLLAATRMAAGREGTKWDWAREEADLRGMTETAREKFGHDKGADNRGSSADQGGGTDNVVNLTDHRAPPGKKTPAIIRVAQVAMQVWGRPLITVDGELWTYEDGVWLQFDGVWEHRLRSCIQGSVEALSLVPGAALLNGAYRYILERPELLRTVTWNPYQILVGRNGTLEVESWEIVPHNPDHLATVKVECELDPEATCPTWLEFVRSTVPEGAGPCLQEWFGAALVRGKARELRKGLIVYGPSRTGKTVITKVLRALLGGRSVGLRVRAMAERFGMQPLVGANGWIADDAVGMREELDAEAYKLIVTGESVSIERKNKTNIECELDMPVLLTMNNYPIVKDDSDAVYNRTLVLPMERVWEEGDALPIADLVVAVELAGVLAWALEGWKRLQVRGRFVPPECMVAAGKEFRSQNNPMDEFLELCVEKSPQMYVMKNDFSALFNAWMGAEYQSKQGWKAKSIAMALAKSPRFKVHSDDTSKGLVWVGIRFKEAALAFVKREFGQAETSLENLNHGFTPAMREKYVLPRRSIF